MLDLRDENAQVVLQTLKNQYGDSHFVWFNLLNLGKLNYFAKKTQTGDIALARTSAVIRNVISEEQLALKLPGSEFLIFSKSPPIEKIALKIEAALNSDPELREIFDDQIRYLEMKLSTESDPDELRKLESAINETKLLRDQPRVEKKNGVH